MNMLFEEIVATEMRSKFNALLKLFSYEENNEAERIDVFFTKREVKEAIYILNDYLNLINKIRKE